MAKRKRRVNVRKYFFGRGGYRTWPIIFILALIYYTGFDPGSSSDYDSLNSSSDQILSFLIPLVIIFLVVFIFNVLRARKLNSDKAGIRENTFRDKPWEYNRMFIELTGRVEYVFKNDSSYVFKKKITHLYRTLTKDGNHAGRHVHERFLLSSPQLVKDENVMVICNTSFDKEKIREGEWVSVKGEYLHELRHDNRKSKNFYGKLHYTHEPVGYVKKVKLGKEELKTLSQTKVKASFSKGPKEFEQ